VFALKVIAPRTRTTKDDKVLRVLEEAMKYLPAGSAVARSAAAVVKDHRAK
jgi:hypothetical protein